MEQSILVATDGQTAALGALKVGRLLAEQARLPLEVVSVCEPLSVHEHDSHGPLPGPFDPPEDLCDRRREAVRVQFGEAGVEVATRVHITLGAPAPSIVRVARERRARLVIVGAGDRSAADRVLHHDETALRLTQSAHVPVITVPSVQEALPTRVMVAVDFSTHSLDAAWTAASILPSRGTLHLAHVVTDRSAFDLSPWRETDWMRGMMEDAGRRLEMLAERIRAAFPRVRVEIHLLDEGRIVPAVVGLAQNLEAEMVAAGTSGYGFLGRLLLGSVATQLVRRSRCMTLVAPPRGVVPEPERPEWKPRGSRALRRTLPLAEERARAVRSVR